MYEVLTYFTDLQDNEYPYNAGDKFPRHGKEVTPERIKELSSSDNRRGEPVIRAIGNKASEKPIGQPINEPKEEHKEDAPKLETKLMESELKEMTVPKIREAARARGFKISSLTREAAVAEFLEKQG